MFHTKNDAEEPPVIGSWPGVLVSFVGIGIVISLYRAFFTVVDAILGIFF